MRGTSAFPQNDELLPQKKLLPGKSEGKSTFTKVDESELSMYLGLLTNASDMRTILDYCGAGTRLWGLGMQVNTKKNVLILASTHSPIIDLH